MIADLHIHTTYSDGEHTPGQAAAMAKQKGLCAIAITDHDECRGCLEAEQEGITVLCGIELSADFMGEAHVLGYGIDCENNPLLAHIEKQNRSRMERAQKMIKLFTKAGIDISMQEVMDVCRGDVLGRPHIADVLVKKGFANSTKQAFTKYLDRHAKFYVPREKVDVKKAAALIIEAGGKPVLAHPGLMPGSAWKQLSAQLKSYGFWGIEAYHPSHSNGQCSAFESYARQNGLFITCGSDFHGSAKPGIEIGQEKRSSSYLIKSLEQLGIECGS